MSALLQVKGLGVRYGAVRAVRDASLDVNQGELVTILGANGAGKSSILRAVMGLQPVAEGQVDFDGVSLVGRRPDQIFARGIALVPENRQVWATLTVEENLRMGWFAGLGRAELRERVAGVYERFPILGERRRQLAGQLSGGEQQLLAFARATMSRPQLMIMDEPSLGLAPMAVRRVFALIAEACRDGLTILMAEQNARAAMKISDRVYLLEHGHVVGHGTPAEMTGNDALQRAYLGG